MYFRGISICGLWPKSILHSAVCFVLFGLGWVGFFVFVFVQLAASAIRGICASAEFIGHPWGLPAGVW